MDEAEALASSSRGAMIAAAGCGKTHLIGTAVTKYGGGRELVLTHTHAGVDAIRRRLVGFDVAPSAYQVDTIAGWALRMAASFPKTSAVPNLMPKTSADWSAVYQATEKLLGLRPIREIVQASYSGVYVDEYQDCAVDQHAIVLKLADIRSCRVVGDPLQGIFDFGSAKSIAWEDHVSPHFSEVEGPTEPHRWSKSNPDLGGWLTSVRSLLEQGRAVDLRGAPVRWIDASDPKWQSKRQRDACLEVARSGEDTVVAIHKWPVQCHELARRLGGAYSCVEAIDCEDLYTFAQRIDGSSGNERAVVVIDFAAKCMTKVKSELKSIRTRLSDGSVPRTRKHPEQLEAILATVESDSFEAVGRAIAVIRRLPGLTVHRRELLAEMRRAIGAVVAGEATSLADAAWVIRNRTRRVGRRLPRRAVGTTLLVKGLEFDHAVIIDGDGYDAQNLYVAMTRGAKSLTIVSQQPLLQPVDGRGATPGQ